MTPKSVDAIYALGVSHNKFPLPLPDGTPYPGYLFNSQVDIRPLEFLKQFNRVRERAWNECTILDLGCSEGSTTFGLSQTGAIVYGVEGRSDGIERAKVLRDIIAFPDTHFVVGNVDHEASYREVDGIFNAGILYHLENPLLCLERSAKFARSFVYLDTGHVPRSERERAEAKFLHAFGRKYTIDWRGLKVEAMEVAEPSQVEEKRSGVRRAPRSGIGNTRSVWLSHKSVIEVMKELGFPDHEVIADVPKIPRLRTAFFRNKPRAIEPLDVFARPLPQLANDTDAILKARARDIAYLQRSGRSVAVIGSEPILSRTIADLRDNNIHVGELIEEPNFKNDVRLANLSGRLIVTAFPLTWKIVTRLVALDKFDYLFSSFGLAQIHNLPMQRPGEHTAI